MTQSTATPSFYSAWWAGVRSRPRTAVALLVALAGVLLLLLSRLLSVVLDTPAVHYALGGGLVGFGSTALGALGALFLRNLSARTEDTMLGFAAGMMLAASSFSLILPALDAGEAITGNALLAALVVMCGLALGAMLMLGLDRFTPHEHEHGGPCGAGCERVGRVWLFVLAIALHNLPEGMAIGVSFSGGDIGVGLPLTAAIGLQNLPEGLAVAMALCAIGMRPLWAALIAGATGAMELLGACVGIGLVGGFALAYPLGLGLAAGAMLFVVSHEVIPETHRNGHQTPATLGLMCGFAVMMLLDTALG